MKQLLATCQAGMDHKKQCVSHLQSERSKHHGTAAYPVPLRNLPLFMALRIITESFLVMVSISAN